MADIEVRLTGWGISDRHETINSLHWGPDGWLYGLQGYATSSKVRKPEGKGRLYAAKEPFPSDLLQGAGRGDQRRRLALSPDEGSIRGGRARLQQPLGHRLRRQGPAGDQRVRHPAPVARDSRGHLPRARADSTSIPTSTATFRRSPTTGTARRMAGRASISRTPSRRRRPAASSWPTSTNTPCSRMCSSAKDLDSRRITATISSSPTTRSGSASASRSAPTATSMSSTGTTATSAARASRTRRPDASSASRRRESLAKDWDGRYGDLKALSDAELVQLQTSASDWHARRARVILQARASAGKLSPAVRAAAARAVHQGRQPGLAAARDVDAARHGAVDARAR